MNKSHKHAGLMLQYAQDALETETPWERWEIKFSSMGGWSSVVVPFAFLEEYEYRRKPRTININGFEVPEPLRVAPEIGTPYFLVDINIESRIDKIFWGNDKSDERWLSRGLIHLTKEAAELHAKALLSFTQK